jgi:hypothetical protein
MRGVQRATICKKKTLIVEVMSSSKIVIASHVLFALFFTLEIVFSILSKSLHFVHPQLVDFHLYVRC